MPKQILHINLFALKSIRVTPRIGKFSYEIPVEDSNKIKFLDIFPGDKVATKQVRSLLNSIRDLTGQQSACGVELIMDVEASRK